MMHANKQNSNRNSQLLSQALICLGFIFLFGGAAVLLGKDINWDLLDYHYYNGYAYTHHRYAQDVMPALMQTYMNPYYDIVNYWLISLHHVRVSVFLLGATSGLSAFFLYKIVLLIFPVSIRRYRALAIWSSLVFGVFGAGNLSLLGTATNDTKLALLSLIALYCMLRVLAMPKNYLFYLLTAAFVSGLGAAFKLPAACYAVGLFVTFVLLTPWNRQHINLYLGFIAFVTLGFLVANGSWMYFVYQHFQNPLFPFYNNIFHSPYAPLISFNFRPSKIDLDTLRTLLLPFLIATRENTLTTERVLQDMHFAVMTVLSAVFICHYLCSQWRSNYSRQYGNNSSVPSESAVIWNFLFTYFWVSYVIWLVIFAVYRYALPLEMLSGLLIVMLIFKLTQRGWQIYGAILLLSVGFAWNTVVPSWSKLALGKDYFAVETPPPLPPSSTVILMNAPLAYVIPFFPTDTCFIGFPFVDLGEKNLTPVHLPIDRHHKMLADVIAQITKSQALYTLALYSGDLIEQEAVSYERSTRILRHFGFSQDAKRCVAFQTNIHSYLKLCPLASV